MDTLSACLVSSHRLQRIHLKTKCSQPPRLLTVEAGGGRCGLVLAAYGGFWRMEDDRLGGGHDLHVEDVGAYFWVIMCTVCTTTTTTTLMLLGPSKEKKRRRQQCTIQLGVSALSSSPPPPPPPSALIPSPDGLMRGRREGGGSLGAAFFC